MKKIKDKEKNEAPNYVYYIILLLILLSIIVIIFLIIRAQQTPSSIGQDKQNSLENDVANNLQPPIEQEHYTCYQSDNNCQPYSCNDPTKTLVNCWPDLYKDKYCSKIDPYNLEVRKAAAEATRNHPGSYNIDQLLDIYDWVKQNINYLNVPIDLTAPYSPSDTLITGSGDCKNQAVLIASMVKSIGGEAEVIAEPSCEHAYAVVLLSNNSSNIQNLVDDVFNHYFCNNGFICGGTCWKMPKNIGAYCDGQKAEESLNCNPGYVGFTDGKCHKCLSGQTLVLKNNGIECRDSTDFNINYFNHSDGYWIIFDPAGGNYPGQTLHECLDQNKEKYFIKSCVNAPE